MKEYTIVIRRTSYAFRTFKIMADDMPTAINKAHNEAGDVEFSEASADYDTDSVTPPNELRAPIPTIGILLKIDKGFYEYKDIHGNLWYINSNTLPKKRGVYRWWSADCETKTLKADTKKGVISEIEKYNSERLKFIQDKFAGE